MGARILLADNPQNNAPVVVQCEAELQVSKVGRIVQTTLQKSRGFKYFLRGEIEDALYILYLPRDK